MSYGFPTGKSDTPMRAGRFPYRSKSPGAISTLPPIFPSSNHISRKDGENMFTEKLLRRLRDRGFDISPRRDLFLLSKDGKQRWLNIREKEKPSYYRFGKRFEYGTPKVHFDRYKKMVARGEPVYSVICERSTGKVYIAPFAALIKTAREYSGNRLDTGGTVFLPKDAYRELR